METHILSGNYDQIRQSLSKYFLCFWGREIEKPWHVNNGLTMTKVFFDPHHENMDISSFL